MREISVAICWAACLILFLVSAIAVLDIRWMVGSGVFLIIFTGILQMQGVDERFETIERKLG